MSLKSHTILNVTRRTGRDVAYVTTYQSFRAIYNPLSYLKSRLPETLKFMPTSTSSHSRTQYST